ncbi:hypothetical protein R6Q59_025087 [Mikania micrantha]
MGYLWPDIGGTWGVPLLKTHRYQPMVWRNVPSLGLDMLLGIHGKFLGYQGRGLAVIFVVFQATWMWHRFCCYLAWSTLLRPGAGSLDVSDGAEVGCHGPLVAWWRGFLLGWVGGRGGIRQLGRGGIRLVLGCLYFPCSASLNLWKHGCKQVAWVGAASGQGLGWSLIGLGLFWAGVWLIRWKPAVAAQFWHVVLLPWLQDMWATPWDLVLVLSTAFSWAGVLHVRPKLRLSGLGGHAMACAAPDMLGEAPDELEAASVWPVAAPAWPVVARIRPHGVPTTLACGCCPSWPPTWFFICLIRLWAFWACDPKCCNCFVYWAYIFLVCLMGWDWAFAGFWPNCLAIIQCMYGSLYVVLLWVMPGVCMFLLGNSWPIGFFFW